MSTTESESPEARTGTLHRWALPIGVLVLFIEGYDLFVLGTIGPTLLEYQPWSATPATLGLLGTVTALGMPVGSIAAGRLSDTRGRRLPIMVGLGWVSLGMLLSGLAPNLTVFTISRFLTGIGIGALTPLVIAFVGDWSPVRRRSLHVGVALCGVALGGVVVGFFGRAVLPGWHFQSLFLVGVLPLVLVPLCWKLVPSRLPEAEAASDSTHDIEEDEAATPIRALFAPRLRLATVLFCVAMFFGLALVYGASTWLPTLMINEGYDLDTALEFMIAFNAGAVLGTLAAAIIADRGHLKVSTVVCFLCAAIAMLVLSTEQARWVILVMSGVAGLGTLGTQNLLNGYVARYYPPRLRGTALGISLGLGRFGAIVGPSYVVAVTALLAVASAGFYGFVVPAVLGAVAIAFIPTCRAAKQRRTGADSLAGAKR